MTASFVPPKGPPSPPAAEVARLLADGLVPPDDLRAEHPGELGVYLAGALRRGLDWSPNPEFWVASEDPPPLLSSAIRELAPDLEQLHQALGLDDPRRIADAFTSIVLWADRLDHNRTALAFAQAAAQIAPDHPVAAWQLGMFARRRAEHAHARRWYRLAIRLGTQQKVWVPVARAWLGLYQQLRTKKHYRLARVASKQALSIAQIHRMHEIEGEAHHALVTCSYELGQPDAGLVSAERALTFFAGRPDKIAILASDLAWYWMVNDGDFARALTIFQARLHEVDSSFDRLCVLANVARAAGGVGDEETLRWAYDRVWAAGQPGAPLDGYRGYGWGEALLEAAHGAHSVGWTKDAERAWEAAMAVYQGRNERPREDAHALGESIQRQKAFVHQRSRHRDGQAKDVAVEQLTERLLRLLRDSKVDEPLKREAQAIPTGSGEILPMEVECDPRDRATIEAVITRGKGRVTGAVEEPDRATICAQGGVPVLTQLVEHPAVHRVGLLVHYGLR